MTYTKNTLQTARSAHPKITLKTVIFAAHPTTISLTPNSPQATIFRPCDSRSESGCPCSPQSLGERGISVGCPMFVPASPGERGFPYPYSLYPPVNSLYLRPNHHSTAPTIRRANHPETNHSRSRTGTPESHHRCGRRLRQSRPQPKGLSPAISRMRRAKPLFIARLCNPASRFAMTLARSTTPKS